MEKVVRTDIPAVVVVKVLKEIGNSLTPGCEDMILSQFVNEAREISIGFFRFHLRSSGR